jgi:hypothetical protein
MRCLVASHFCFLLAITVILANILPIDVSEEEPEEDYVALTLSRKGGQIKDPEEEAINTGAIDKEFLDESWGPKGVHNTKGKLVKVDKREFIDVTEKIAKQNTVDAFRARFQSSKTKARAPRTVSAGTSGRGGEEDDLDAFLGELALDDGEYPAMCLKMPSFTDWTSHKGPPEFGIQKTVV